jgi:hypothetical protein
MTKVLEHIEARLTGVRIPSEPSRDDFISFREDSLYPLDDYCYDNEIRVDLRVGAYSRVPNSFHQAEVTEALKQTKKHIGRLIAKELYGEVTEEVYHLYKLLMQRMYLPSNDPISQQLDKILNMMEYDG